MGDPVDFLCRYLRSLEASRQAQGEPSSAEAEDAVEETPLSPRLYYQQYFLRQCPASYWTSLHSMFQPGGHASSSGSPEPETDPQRTLDTPDPSGAPLRSPKKHDRTEPEPEPSDPQDRANMRSATPEAGSASG